MQPQAINIKDYTYTLPTEKIAIFPLPNRDDSKLLLIENDSLKEDIFYRMFDVSLHFYQGF